MKPRILIIAGLLALSVSVMPALGQSRATYRVTFEASWSQSTHPEDFPSNPHFSGLIGATHGDTEYLWQVGELASPGIESMAETGAKSLLRGEISQLTSLGWTLDGGGIGLSPGVRDLTFETTEAASQVSLVSMLAPSPDWFVGVSGLNLREGDTWRAEVVVDLYVYDAGTDDGATYQASNQESTPHVAIQRIEILPFLVDGQVEPVGTFTFTLAQVTDTEPELPAPGFEVSLYPNPSAGQAVLAVTGGQSSATAVRLFDLLGREVLDARAIRPGLSGLQTVDLDLRDLAPGTYLLVAQNGRDQASQVLVALGRR